MAPPDASERELISELALLAPDVGRTPTESLMAGQARYDPADYHVMFESWENALQQAGFELESLDRERYDVLHEIDSDQRTKIVESLESNDRVLFRGQLLVELHRLAVELGESPSSRQMRTLGRYQDNTYATHFGSWNDTITEAGLSPNRPPSKRSKDELVAELRRLAKSLDRVPTTSDMEDHGAYSVPTYYTHSDSWENACDEAGLTISMEQCEE